jgi:DNA mismatch repair protein MSH4
LLKLIIGLQLARLADLPKDAVTHAGKIASDLSTESARGHKSSESCKVARRRKAVLKVCCDAWKRPRTFDTPILTFTTNSQMRTTLTQAFERSGLPDREFLAYLTSLQEKLTRELADNL